MPAGLPWPRLRPVEVCQALMHSLCPFRGGCDLAVLSSATDLQLPSIFRRKWDFSMYSEGWCIRETELWVKEGTSHCGGGVMGVKKAGGGGGRDGLEQLKQFCAKLSLIHSHKWSPEAWASIMVSNPNFTCWQLFRSSRYPNSVSSRKIILFAALQA